MSKQHVLIVDDEPDIRELLEITLSRMGLETVTAQDLQSAKSALSQHSFNLCLTDMKLPDGNGISLVEHIQAQSPELPVAIITAFGSMDLAINALKAGAFDFISKPIDLDMLRGIIQSALNLSPSTNIESSESIKILGKSPSIISLLNKIQKLSRSQAPVFIHGESGSGKELIARSIHELSPREGDFIAINCGAIPSELMESEFFGHKKGSFTGANNDKAGLFLSAQGGTLFLDEVADLPLDMQVKLLRAIQEKSVRPVGSEKEIPVDVRILSATHKNLQEEINTGRFRQDLFFRINVIQLDAPALRERKDDIPELCEYFLNQLNEKNDVTVTLSNQALNTLINYSFPGNVRELENILERAYTLCENNQIEETDLLLNNIPTNHQVEAETSQQDEPEPPPPVNSKPAVALATPGQFQPTPTIPEFDNLDEYIVSIEKDIIQQALEASRWNKTAAAKLLGISFRQLRYKLQKLKLD